MEAVSLDRVVGVLLSVLGAWGGDDLRAVALLRPFFRQHKGSQGHEWQHLGCNKQWKGAGVDQCIWFFLEGLSLEQLVSLQNIAYSLPSLLVQLAQIPVQPGKASFWFMAMSAVLSWMPSVCIWGRAVLPLPWYLEVGSQSQLICRYMFTIFKPILDPRQLFSFAICRCLLRPTRLHIHVDII